MNDALFPFFPHVVFEFFTHFPGFPAFDVIVPCVRACAHQNDTYFIYGTSLHTRTKSTITNIVKRKLLKTHITMPTAAATTTPLLLGCKSLQAIYTIL